MSSTEQSPAPGSVHPWVLLSLLVIGCLITGLWAIPQLIAAHELAEGSESSYSAPAAVDPTTVTATGSVDTAALDTSLATISKNFRDGTLTGLVVDSSSGAVLYSDHADRPQVPASNLKLLTDYTVVRTLDPYSRFTTSVTLQGNTLTLVAGGDTLLGTGRSHDGVVGHAGLQNLAEETYAALKDRGPGNYTLNLDTSIYSGESTNPAWSDEDIAAQEVGGISPVAFYSHYSPGEDGNSTSFRPDDAAQQVQQYLLDRLKELGSAEGMNFTLGESTDLNGNAQTIASVESATVAEQAAYMMQQSDNMLAEALGRNASVAHGGNGSYRSARELVLHTLETDGIPTDQLNMVDLCGLSGDNRITNITLAAIIRAMVAGDNGADVALAGLPVAGGSGSLTDRFDDADEQAAAGYARAKTGTLNSVIALSGYTVTESGHTLIFSFLANDVTNTSTAKDTIDTSVAAIRQR